MIIKEVSRKYSCYKASHRLTTRRHALMLESNNSVRNISVGSLIRQCTFYNIDKHACKTRRGRSDDASSFPTNKHRIRQQFQQLRKNEVNSYDVPVEVLQGQAISEKDKCNSRYSQLHRRTQRLIELLRQTSDVTDNNKRENRESNGSWIMNQVHNIMFQWVTLPPSHKQFQVNTKQQECPNSNNNFKSVGFMVESLLHAVVDHYQQKKTKNRDLTGASQENGSIQPTIQMYKYSMEAWIQQSKSLYQSSEPYTDSNNNYSSDGISLEKAEKIYQKLCNFVNNCLTDDCKFLGAHDLLWEEGNQFSANRDYNNANGMINSCFSLLTHELLNQKVHSSIQRSEQALHRLSRLYALSEFQPLQVEINVDTNAHESPPCVHASDDSSNCTNLSTIRWNHTTTSINAILHILASKGDTKSLSDAFILLSKIVDNTNKEYENTKSNRFTFNILLHGYAKAGDTEKVESILKWFESLYHDRKITFQPDTVSYNSLMNAYAKSADIRSCKKAIRLLQWMRKNELQDGNENVTSQSNNHHISCDDGGGRSDHTHAYITTPPTNCSPDVVTYTAAINALSKNGMAKEAHKLLNDMIHSLEADDNQAEVLWPDRVIFSAVADAWAKSKQDEAVERCWEIIHAMVALSKEGSNDDSNGRVGDVTSSSSSAMRQSRSNIGPSTVTFNSLIYAIGNSRGRRKSRGDNVGAKALEVLSFMKNLHSVDARPNVTTYNTILSILGKRNQLEDARVLFHEMQQNDEIEINIITINTFIDALSRDTRKTATAEALSLLEGMKQKEHSFLSDITPNTRTYNTILKVISKSGPEWFPKVELFLDEMEAMYRNGEASSTVIPNTITYTTVIHAISRMTMKNKAERSLAILRRMEYAVKNGNKHAFPNTMTYNGLLNACCFVTYGDKSERKKALSISNIAIIEMNTRSNCKPDHITYATMVKILARHMPKGNDCLLAIEEIFNQCRRSNNVSDFVLKELRSSVPKKMYERLTQRI